MSADPVYEPRSTSLSTDEIVLPPLLMLLDDIVEICISYDVEIDKALLLLRDAYIRAQVRKNSDTSLRLLCTSTKDDPAVIPMSRNTVASVRKAAFEYYRKSLISQMESAIRLYTYVPVEDGEDRTRVAKSSRDIYDHVRQHPTFVGIDLKDLRVLFDECMAKLTTETVERVGDDLFLNMVGYKHNTSEALALRHQEVTSKLATLGKQKDASQDETNELLEIKRNIELDEMALVLRVVKKSSTQLRRRIEGRFLRYYSGLSKEPERQTGIQTVKIDVLPHQLAEIDSFYYGVIEPYLRALTKVADEVHKRLGGLALQESIEPLPKCEITFMWGLDPTTSGGTS